MTGTRLLEVTITHKLLDVAEVKELFRRQLIALDWGRKGPDPGAYTGRGYVDVSLFHTMRIHGAAVVAAYKKATPNPSIVLLAASMLGQNLNASTVCCACR